MTTPRKVVASMRLDTTPSLNITPQRNKMIEEDVEQSISQMNCDKESGNAAGDGEGIIVAIRMRPLNSKESSERRIWKVLPHFKSVTQTTPTGKPLPERIMGRTFFTFDKTYGEDIDTHHVYEEIASGIVNSVVRGLNGTIFAYGQTSSGKTYTMQGSGSIEEGSVSGGGGIVHMAARDIFNHITNSTDRVYLVRASFVEIYNEEVRDLLSAHTNVLQIREDPRRGVFVNSEEEIAVDFGSLLQVLFKGEKNRAVAATGMNERSSRSHTIFRITIESREKVIDNKIEGYGGEDDGAVRISTLNLVDLAGSESVRHTGNTGDRLKEGGKINQSLLTLSRVIVALGDPSQTHINFRDSKLTRILQPSLSGNARMAIICCATPSELYLEETRSTLSFASRAKLVKTNAKVNEVLDDQSLIRRLQRELAVAKRSISGDGNYQNEQLQALATEAANAGKERQEALEKLKRLQRSILNSNALFESKSISTDIKSNDLRRRKRRRSDSAFQPDRSFLKASLTSRPLTPKYEPLKVTAGEAHVTLLSPKAELDLVRQALAAKGNQSKAWQDIVSKRSSELEITQSKLTAVELNRNEVHESLIESQIHVGLLKDQLNNLQNSHDNIVLEKEKLIELLDDEKTSNKKLLLEITNIQSSKDQIQSAFATEKADMEAIIKDFRFQIDSMFSEFKSKEKILEERLVDKDSELQNTKNREKSLSEENLRIAFQFAQLMVEKDSLQKERDDDKAKIQKLGGEVSLLMGTMKDACQEKDELRAQIQILSESCKNESAEKEAIKTALQATTEKLESVQKSLQSENSQSKSFIKQIQCEMEDIKSDLSKKDLCLLESIKALEEVKASCDQLKSDAIVKEREYANIQEEQERKIHDLSSDVDELLKTISEKEEELVQATQTIESLTVQHTTLQSLAQSKDTAIQDLTREMNDAKMHTSVLESHAAKQAETQEQLRCEYEESMKALEEHAASLLQEIDDLKAAVSTKENDVIDAQNTIEALDLEVQKAKSLISEKDTFIERLDNENHSMQERVHELESQIISKEDALTNLQCQTADLLNQLSDAQSKLSEQTVFIDQLQLDQEKSVSDLETKIIDLAKDITDLQVTLESKEDVIRAQMLSNEVLKTNVAQAENNAIESGVQLQRAESSYHKSLAIIDQLELQVNAKVEQIDGLHNDVALLREKLSEAEKISTINESSVGKLSIEHQEYVKESEHLLSQLKEEVDALKIELLNKENEVKDRSKTLEEVKASCDQLKSDAIVKEREYANIQEEQERKIHDLSSDVDELLKTISEKEEELVQATQTIESLTVQHTTLQSLAQSKDTAIQDLTREMNDAKMHTSVLESHAAKQAETQEQLRCEYEESMKALEEHVASLLQEIDDLKAAVSTKENDVIDAQNTIGALDLEVQKAKSLISEKDTFIERLDNENHSMQERVHELESQIISKEDALTNLQCQTADLLNQLSDAQSKLSEQTVFIDQLQLDQEKSVSDLETKIIDLAKDITDLQVTLESKEDVIRAQMLSIEALQKDIAQAENNVIESGIQLQSAESSHHESLAIIEQLELQVNAKVEQIDGLHNDVALLREKLSQAEKISTINESSLGELSIEHQEYVKESEHLLSQLKEEVDALKIELLNKENEVKDRSKTLEEVKASYDQLKSDAIVKGREFANIQEEQERKIHDLISDVDELLKTISEKEEELVQATQTIESLTVQHTTLQSLAQSKDTAIQDLTREMNDAKMHTSVLESHAAKQAETQEQLRCEYEESMKALEEHAASLLQEIDDLKAAVSTKENDVIDAQNTIGALDLEVQKAKSLISEKDTFIERLDNENHSMQERVHELESQIISKEDALTNLQCQTADLLNQLSDAQSKLSEQTVFIDQLQLDQEKSVSDLETKIIDLAKDITDLQVTLESKEDVIRAQMLSIEALQKDIASQEALVAEKDFAFMNLLREKNEMEKELSFEKEKYVQDQIDSLVVSQNKLTDELAHYRNVSDSMTLDNQSNVKLIESLKYELAVLEKERDDLSQLLSVSNESIREARQAAFEADEELDLKERKLEEVLNRLSEREEELSIVNEQLFHMQHQNKSMDGDLTDKVKGLIDENSRLQVALSHSLDDRKSCEMEYKRKMGEEQRQLIKEAEAEMIALRTARDHLKSALSQSESDAIVAKQKLDDLSLSNKRLETKYSDTRKVIDKLESELSTLKVSYTELSSEKDQMVMKLSGLKQKLAQFDLKANEEVSKLELELKLSKSQTFEARQRVLDLEDYLRNLESQGKKNSEELEEEKKYRIGLESKIVSLQGEIKNLLLGKLEERHDVANEKALAEMKEKLKDLNQELQKKDSRIKKLEAVRLTREQCAALKKIKEERVKFQQENENYQNRLVEAEAEIRRLQAQSGDNHKARKAGEDITALRFEKEALETKLRKYLAYCKALESDKAQIVDALRTRKRNIIDDDFAGAVVSLCDQVTSLEEECESLAESERRVSSYIAEIEMLSEQIVSLENKLNASESKSQSINRSEAELITALRNSEEKCASLLEERAKLKIRATRNNQECEPEKSRQVKYLEQENLQLMMELKSAKKKLQAARSEIDNLRMEVLDEDSEDFDSYETTKIQENKENIQKEIKLPSSTLISNEKLVGSPRKVRSSRQSEREGNRRGIGLGMARDEDDNTSECRQS